MKKLSWNDERVRAWVYQLIILGLVVGCLWYLVDNTLHNLSSRNIQTGFGFLNKEAGFAIGESFIHYDLTDTYWQAIQVGIVNTLFVSLVGILLSTVLGTFIGIGRLSKNWLVNRLSAVYVEVMRNIPLLIHLFFWYALLTEILPGPRQALNPVDGVFLSNRGIKFPALIGTSVEWLLWGVLIAVVLGGLISCWAKRKQNQTGQTTPVLLINIGVFMLVLLLACAASGFDLQLVKPVLRGFNFEQGWSISPELAALLIGLVLYTASFVAEIVRSGIQSVSKGQWEAGASLGLSRSKVLRLIVMPQAVRVMIPAMSNTFMNFTKNSSLAVAIGYPDIVSIVNTMLTQTGQAIEAVIIIMLAYFTISISIALFMAWYNHRMALVER
ncbi:amino acid ABC transporter permease [Pelistega europaea]|uniref:ABC transporter permease subunit n=1 Tax=Pelistega europaea TaxID=106147 RepID=A0A7Y4LBC7_9BURK|nr:ABC transporter permease subunit [Pelistega europaea]NOL49312.1 ABC transporter permease subunit [Pelistega europaea]